jgi:hypothetical protein
MTHIIEEEAGSFGPSRHPHNGYYAGDFSAAPFNAPDVRSLPTLRPATVITEW